MNPTRRDAMKIAAGAVLSAVVPVSAAAVAAPEFKGWRTETISWSVECHFIHPNLREILQRPASAT